MRRRKLPAEMAEEVAPKNILMIGPTGVGKTEIARRLAKLAQAPFIKVEATKFTEVGYVGRDVEQIVRDLVEVALNTTREKLRRQVEAKAEVAAEERVIDALVGEAASADTRAKFRRMSFSRRPRLALSSRRRRPNGVISRRASGSCASRRWTGRGSQRTCGGLSRSAPPPRALSNPA